MMLKVQIRSMPIQVIQQILIIFQILKAIGKLIVINLKKSLKKYGMKLKQVNLKQKKALQMMILQIKALNHQQILLQNQNKKNQKKPKENMKWKFL